MTNFVNCKFIVDEKQAEIERLRELNRKRYAEWEEMQELLCQSQAREAKLRDMFEYLIAEAKLTSSQYELCRQALALPHDDTALRAALQDATNAAIENSPENALLNRIGRLLGEVEYRGDYAAGIRALVVFERKKVLLEAADRLGPDDAVSGSYREWLRRMAEEE